MFSASPHLSVANKWLMALAVMLAAFIKVMDVAIANVALDHICGSLSASKRNRQIW